MFHYADQTHRELGEGLTLDHCLEMTADWQDHLPSPKLVQLDHFTVVDESVLGVGSKARFGDMLVQWAASVGISELVYVQPRVGWAGLSLAYLAKRYGLKLTLFMPASKAASAYQLAAIEAGASPVFKRIAAMPNLNKIAAAYARESPERMFIPLGLRHPMVTASIVRVAHDLTRGLGHEPEVCWTVISTGVLSRGLQIAWPKTEFTGVAVARNLQAGELGRAQFVSDSRPFTQAVRTKLPVDSALNYDAKGLERMLELASIYSEARVPMRDASKLWFWNVAGEPPPTSLRPEDVPSDVPW